MRIRLEHLPIGSETWERWASVDANTLRRYLKRGRGLIFFSDGELIRYNGEKLRAFAPDAFALAVLVAEVRPSIIKEQ